MKPRWRRILERSGLPAGKNFRPVRALIERGRETKAVDYQRALRKDRSHGRELRRALHGRYDAILTAPALGTAPRGLGATGDPVFCVAVDGLLGSCQA